LGKRDAESDPHGYGYSSYYGGYPYRYGGYGGYYWG
jgi:hypothetical protein